jgi:outer membrane protein assembly factor BamB
MNKSCIALCIIIIMSVMAVSCSDSDRPEQTYRLLKAFSHRDYAKPVVVGDRVISTSDNRLYCRDKKTGDVRWVYEFKNDVQGTPATDGTYIYALTPYELASIDIETGNEVWEKESTEEFISEVFYYKDNLYILGHERLYSIASKLEDPKPAGAESVGQVHINQILYDYNMVNQDIGAVIDFHTDTAFMVLFENQTNTFTRLVAIKLSGYNMKELWSYSVDREIVSIMGVDDGGQRVYFSTADGVLHAVGLTTGKHVFSSPAE